MGSVKGRIEEEGRGRGIEERPIPKRCGMKRQVDLTIDESIETFQRTKNMITRKLIGTLAILLFVLLLRTAIGETPHKLPPDLDDYISNALKMAGYSDDPIPPPTLLPSLSATQQEIQRRYAQEQKRYRDEMDKRTAIILDAIEAYYLEQRLKPPPNTILVGFDENTDACFYDPMPGYEWVNPGTSDLRVKPINTVMVVDENTGKVAYRPATGYTWANPNSSPPDFRVKPINNLQTTTGRKQEKEPSERTSNNRDDKTSFLRTIDREENLSISAIIFMIMLTWGVGLAPALIFRFVIYRRPMTKVPAIIVTILFFFINIMIVASDTIFQHSKSSHHVQVLIAFAIYGILVTGKRK